MSSAARNGGSRVVLLTLITILLALMVGFAYQWAQKTVTVYDGAQAIVINTFATNVGDALAETGISLRAEDVVEPALGTAISEDASIHITRAFSVSIIADGQEQRVITPPERVAKVLDKAGIKISARDMVTPGLTQMIHAGQGVKVTRVTEETVTETEEVPFGIERKEDQNLARGLRRVIQQGRPGEKSVTTVITYEDGVEVKREVVAEEVTVAPQQQVVAMGAVQHYSRGSRNFRFDKALEVVATGYTHTGNKTYTGKDPEAGTVAVDPEKIPLGTRLYVEGYGYAEAEDIGGAIKGNRIDLFFDTRENALQWGRRSVLVYILD